MHMPLGSPWLFAGFKRDELTTLPETWDRLFGTEATITWIYSGPPADFAATRTEIMDSLLTTFANHDSLSVQQTLYAMAGEVLAAMVLVFLGVTMLNFKIPLVGFLVLSPGSGWTPLLTALWVIVITNAVNLIDGLDGLATGIVAIASGALAVYGMRLVDLGYLPPDNLGPLIAVIAFGVCIGFLPHNFHPARVFIGDAGALFLGLLMAAATMVIGGRTPDVSGQTYFFFAPLFIPLFILGVPIADMAFAFIRRTAKGTGFHTPDKDHGGDPVGVDRGVVGFRPLSPFRPAGQRRDPFRSRHLGPGPVHLVSSGAAQERSPRSGSGRGGPGCGGERGCHHAGPGPSSRRAHPGPDTARRRRSSPRIRPPSRGGRDPKAAQRRLRCPGGGTGDRPRDRCR